MAGGRPEVAVAHETLALADVGEARGEERTLPEASLGGESMRPIPSSNPPARGPGHSFRSGSHMSLNSAIRGAVRIRPRRPIDEWIWSF
jgi:hypothetical protein